MIKKYWSWLVIPLISACAVWFVSDYVFTTNSPVLIVDPSVEYEYGGVIMHPPVEITGKPIEEGERFSVCSNVPEEWEQYIHYENANWSDTNPFNPEGKVAKPLLYSLFGVLAIMCGLLIWRIYYLRKQGKLKKLAKMIGDK